MHRKNIIYLSLMMVLMTISAQAQNTMGVGTTTPNPNAVLDLVSPTNNQGLLVPRLTTVQRTDVAFTSNLTAADNGLMVFDSDEGQFYFWFSGSWQAVQGLSSGDMSTATYDTDLDGKVDSAQFATIAGAIDGFNIESSVPAGAVFTDSQTALDVAYDNLSSGLAATDVQSAIDEVAISSGSPWTPVDTSLVYNGGYVGVGVTAPLSPLQVNEFNYFRFDGVINGEFIANNLYADATTVRYVNDGPSGAIFFSDLGQIEFLIGRDSLAGADATTGAVESVLQITADRDVNLFGGIRVSQANTLFPNDGLLSFDAGRLQVYEGGQFVNVTGLDLPFSSSLIEDGTSLLGLVNQGTAGVATFTVDNASGNAALRINSNSTVTTGRGVEVNHTGDAVAGQFELSGGLSGATTYAVLGRTDGLGSAGRFEVNNASNISAAVLGRVDAGGGPAIEGFTLGEGPIARFRNQNAGNGSVGLIVSNDGVNSAATFTANSSVSPGVEIFQNSTGPALVVQSPGGTSTVGDVTSFLAGNVGIGTNTPVTELEVVGTATATTYAYPAPVIKRYSIDPTDFILANNTAGLDRELTYLTNAVGVQPSSGTPGLSVQVAAPVHLPDGVTVTAIEVFANNNNAGDVSMLFVEKSLSTARTEIVSGTLAGGSPGIIGTSLTTAVGGSLPYVIDNFNSYQILINAFTNEVSITGVRITYQKTTVD